MTSGHGENRATSGRNPWYWDEVNEVRRGLETWDEVGNESTREDGAWGLPAVTGARSAKICTKSPGLLRGVPQKWMARTRPYSTACVAGKMNCKAKRSLLGKISSFGDI